MFNVAAYIQGLNVTPDDEDFINYKQQAEITLLACDDAYLARADFWGMATARENQVLYIGDRLLPNVERQLNQLTGRGINSESNETFRFSNEEAPHINEEVSIEELVADKEAMIDQLNDKMRRAAIGLVIAVQNHDELSQVLGQLTYSGIKAQASTKRANQQKQTATG